MNDVTEAFWCATPEAQQAGYMRQSRKFLCLLCGHQIASGIIYPHDGVLYEAETYMRLHIEAAHGSVFEHLVQMDKRLTGLTEHQNKLLKLFHQGRSDGEIMQEMGIGSMSTIRNHRFALKEKERQAKVFVTLMELSKEPAKQASAKPKKTAANDKRLDPYFPYGLNGPLASLPGKDKPRRQVMAVIAQHFQPGTTYHEKEINDILSRIYEDHVTIRRYLIEYGILDRKPDGSEYWLREQTGKGNDAMNRRKELQQMYKEIKTQAGVYQVRNKQNGKLFIDTTANMNTLNGKRFQLNMGSHVNKALQSEWSAFGEDAFEIEVLELVDEKRMETAFFDMKETLRKLEEKWLQKLEPYGDRGYHIKRD